ncbi:response regulator receiver protein [Halobacteriales archaeon QH_10_67_22]|nr:MAG: response regulator receiver protein [Halobacteriales archaeon QH_10_67_22]
MGLFTPTVSVFEANRTRADLYALWLDEFDVAVDVALTRREAEEILDGTTGVAVVNRDFAGGEAPKLVEIVREHNPVCTVVATRERSQGFPGVDPEYHLVEPVFEDDLVETVRHLLCRAHYKIALVAYYRTTASLASLEFPDDDPTAEERDLQAELEARVSRLQSRLATLRGELDEEDVATIMSEISVRDDIEYTDDDEKTVSKYHPDRCTNCGRDWDITSDDERASGFRQLGAFVWRCVDCGYVQMQADPSHQQVGSYRL